MTEHAETFASLSPDERRALLAGLLRTRSSEPETHPLSFAQQRLWFLDRLVPENAFYNMDTALRLRTPIDADVLQQCVNEIVCRHQILRTTFRTMDDGTPVQVVAHSMWIELPVVDLSELLEDAREVEALRLATAEAQQPFDLTTGPLIRTTLLRLEAADHVLLLTLHHIVFDGWSRDIFFRELAALYAAFAAGEPSPLAPLPIQYADFAVWQRQWLRGEPRERQLAYWRDRLAQLPPLDLATDHPRPAIQTHAGSYHALTLSLPLTHALRTLAQREGVTLFMTLLAAFQLLLARYTGQDDIVVGCPIAGRTRVETEGLIGFFVNSLVLRTDLSGEPSVRALLGRVREVALGAYAHQDLPFEMLVEALHPERDLSRNPLFQVAFSLQNRIGDETELLRSPEEAPPSASMLAVESGTAKFDLTLLTEETSAGISVLFEYRTALFESDSIERMAGHYVSLLEGMLADPDARISSLPLLTPRERRQLLVEWNDTSSGAPTFECVHHMVESHARRAPASTALIAGDQTLSYAELDAWASALAGRLRARGVRPGVVVALCLERSAALIAAVLGVLAAGGAYLPLDPAYPLERLRFMLADSGARVVLADARGSARLGDAPAAAGVRVLRLDLPDADAADDLADLGDLDARAAQDAQDAHPARDAHPAPTADDLAYVIYTSGSTGRPKGVMISHRGVCNAADAAFRLLGIEPTDRVLQFASLSFDASMCEMLMAFRMGAALCVADEASLLPGPPLMRLIAEHEVTVALLPPSALVPMDPERLPTLRLLAVCGEPFTAELVARWAPTRRLVNLYGPTETSMFVTVAELTSAHRRPDIGRPIGNTRIYVVDRRLEPVPIGVPGELLVGGTSVGRGYLNRPELTAEKFITDPFGEPGARLYRTGDLVRYLPDARIDFLGRLDHQVKVRGFRVELGEVETLLFQHPSVRDVVVIAHEYHPGDKRLLAYVVPREGWAPSTTELRRFLQYQLPEYMVPASFVVLTELPLMPNGKVDRNALLPPEHQRPELEGGYRAPRTALERTIGAVWQEVLELERVGVDDNFFDLGGHSLLMIQLQTKLEAVLDAPLSIVELFHFPTVSALAAHLDDPSWASSEPALRHAQQRAEKQKDARSQRRGDARERPSPP